MYDATLLSESAKRVTIEGRARLSWAASNGATHLSHAYNTDPLRFLFPRTEPKQPQTAVLVTTSGGLVGGDQLDIEIATEPEAEALVMTQAAEKIYRSVGQDTRIEVTFHAGAHSYLEWLPHETILFNGARLDRRTRLNLAEGSRAIAGEILVFGRAASGEVIVTGAVRESWEVYQNGRLIWGDAFQIDNQWDAISRACAGLAGSKAMATIICATNDTDMARDAARLTLNAHETDNLRASATIIGGLVLVRILADDARKLRCAFTKTWGSLRAAIGDYGATLPRLWHI